MRIAVFDLGTNVFNLLIAQVSKNKCDIKKVSKIGSHIGEGGFQRGSLTENALNSSMDALAKLTNEIEAFGGVQHIKAFATSAVRDSSNGQLLVQMVKDKFGFDLDIISGDREAELIYKGIRESILLYKEKVLMVDVGGGSNELIIADKDKIYWKQSFPLGVIRMKELLAPSDPIAKEEIVKYIEHLDFVLEPFYKEIEKHSPKLMIGSSGSFDTLRELIDPEDDFSIPAKELPLDKFHALHGKLLSSTKKERFAMAGMSPLRAEYMVLGSIFVDHVIGRSGITELYQSSYSLKEGYMSEFAATIQTKE